MKTLRTFSNTLRVPWLLSLALLEIPLTQHSGTTRPGKAIGLLIPGHAFRNSWADPDLGIGLQGPVVGQCQGAVEKAHQPAANPAMALEFLLSDSVPGSSWRKTQGGGRSNDHALNDTVLWYRTYMCMSLPIFLQLGFNKNIGTYGILFILLYVSGGVSFVKYYWYLFLGLEVDCMHARKITFSYMAYALYQQIGLSLAHTYKPLTCITNHPIYSFSKNNIKNHLLF